MSIPATRRITLIEDNPADHHLFGMAVRAAGYDAHIHWIKQGEEALSYLTMLGKNFEQGEFPEVIFMDLNLPRFRGDEILEILHKSGFLPDVPIVIISSSEINVEKEKTLALGASSFLQKPLDLEQLTRLVGNVLHQYL